MATGTNAIYSADRSQQIYDAAQLRTQRNVSSLREQAGAFGRVASSLKGLGDEAAALKNLTTAASAGDAAKAVKAFAAAHNQTVQDVRNATGEKGVLRNESAPIRAANTLRYAATRTTDGGPGGDALSRIGISYGRDGSLKVDETRLNKALTNDSAGTLATLRQFGGSQQSAIDSVSSAQGALATRQTTLNNRANAIEAQGLQADQLRNRIDQQNEPTRNAVYAASGVLGFNSGSRINLFA